jgi:hypothetical protein
MSEAIDESELLRLLRSTEHTFVERKTVGDSKDWLKTVVAFANTLEANQVGVLFIGAKDSGEIEENPANLDKLQRTFSEKMQSAYPPIYYSTRAIAHESRECLAVIVPGSPNKPHYAGPAYLRDGSQTIVAKAEQHELLLASRIGKARALQAWIGKVITVRTFSRRQGMGFQLDQSELEAKVIECNQFYLTVDMSSGRWSYPFGRFEIAYDHKRNRLEIEVTAPPVV